MQVTRTKYQRKPKDASLKGPGLRLNLDVRRLWRCPACQTERHTAGHVTFVECHFCQDHPPMTLVETQRPNRDPIPWPESLIELHPDDIDAPAFVPAHLREPEDQPPGDETPADETAAGETSPSPAASEEAVVEVEVPAVAASPATADQTSPPADAPERGKKKSRRKRSRRGNESAPSDQTGRGAQSSTTNIPASADPPSSPDDSFGAGLEPS